MMKRLLGSTALVSAVLFAGEAAKAETPALAAPKLTISGQSTFASWWFRNKDVRKNNVANVFRTATPYPAMFSGANGDHKDCPKGYGDGYLFTVDDSRLKFDINGKTDPGMEYGFTIVFNADTNETRNIKENYLYFGGTWGRLTLGDHDGVEDTMAFYGGDPLGGTGGFDGNFDRVVNFTDGSVHSVDLVGETGKSTKITYQTPRWRGFQLGASYTPHVNHKGQEKINSIGGYGPGAGETPRMNHSIAGALNYIHKFQNGLEMGLSGTLLFADTESECAGYRQITSLDGTALTFNNRRENVGAFALGYLLSYKGFEWGGEFGWNGRSNELKSGFTDGAGKKMKARDSYFIDTGFGYNWGATKVAAGYYYAQRSAVRLDAHNYVDRKNARTHIATVTVDHKLAPGVAVFFEYDYIKMENEGFKLDWAANNAFSSASTKYTPVKDNRANVFVLGTKIKF